MKKRREGMPDIEMFKYVMEVCCWGNEGPDEVNQNDLCKRSLIEIL